jgi:hypothetical protein
MLEENLPQSIVNDALYYSSKKILAPAFKTFKSSNLIRDLVKVLENRVFMPGDFIAQINEVGKEMFFLRQGEAEMNDEMGKKP